MWREAPKGTIFIGESYNFKLSKDSIINTIEKMGYNCEYHRDTVVSDDSYQYNSVLNEYYQTDNIIRYWDNNITVRDTIANVKYTLTEIKSNKTKLTIINVTLSGEGNIQNWQILKSLSKQYNKWLKNNLIEKID
jgi:hypothetical protein